MGRISNPIGTWSRQMEGQNYFARYSGAGTGLGQRPAVFWSRRSVVHQETLRRHGRDAVRDYRQGTDWLAVGKAAICFFCEADVSKQQGLPVDILGRIREGAGEVRECGTLVWSIARRMPMPQPLSSTGCCHARGRRIFRKLCCRRKIPSIRCVSIFLRMTCRCCEPHSTA